MTNEEDTDHERYENMKPRKPRKRMAGFFRAFRAFRAFRGKPYFVSLVCAFGMTAIVVAQSRTAPPATPAASEFDWPQWQGPDRTGLSKETGLLQQWPPAGPPLAWSIAGLGAGYGSMAIQGDRIFVQGSKSSQSLIYALNRGDGKGVWSKALGRAGNNDRGPGPRGTPTLDGDRVYVLTETGDLACLKAADGAAVWQRNILADFGGRQIPWLISESPLVDGNNVIVTPGGPRAGIVALDKMSG